MKNHFAVKLTLFFLLFALIMTALAFLLGSLKMPKLDKKNDLPANASVPVYQTVIIDAGHGGEDGGATSAAGLVEKEVNLDISLTLCDMLRASGINVVMTRTDDRLLYDRNVNFKGRKKKLDLAARRAVAESIPDAIFISIHMNSFTDPKYSGLQVWYSPNNVDSAPLAESIRSKNREMIQINNTRKCKAATSAINLLHNAKCPAVLVECGFLSNPDEAALFESEEHRQRVAFMLYCSLIAFLDTENK